MNGENYSEPTTLIKYDIPPPPPPKPAKRLRVFSSINNYHPAVVTIQQSVNNYLDDGAVHRRNLQPHGQALIKRNVYYMQFSRFYFSNYEKQSHFLPDDIMHEILSRALRVSDADFTVDVSRSPFGRQSPSAVNILLVCQQWYRIGHPYLYECLVFRNTFQLQSFYNMLMWYEHGKTDYQKAKMGRLRLGVRRLRLEDTFGTLLSESLKLLDVSRIVALFIHVNRCVDERNTSTYSGTVAAINAINPNHLVLDWRIATSLLPVRFIDTLIEKIPQWRRLETLEVHTYHGHLPMLSALIENLLKAGTNPSKILFRLRHQQGLQQLIPIFWHCQESASKPEISLLIDMPHVEMTRAAEEVKGRLSTFPKTLKIFSLSCTPGIFLPLFGRQGNKQVIQGQIRRLPVRVILKIVHYYMEFVGRVADERQYYVHLNRYFVIKEISHSKDFQDYCTNEYRKILYIPNKRKLEDLSDENVFSLGPDVSRRRRLDQLIINPGFAEPESWRHLLPPVVNLLFETLLQKAPFLNIPLRLSMLPKAPNEELHTLTLNMTHPCARVRSFLSTGPDASSNVAIIFSCFPKVQNLYLTGCSLAELSLTRPTSYLHQSTVKFLHLDGTDESIFMISKCMFVSVQVMYVDFKLRFPAMARPVDLITVLYHTPNLQELSITMESYKMCFFETPEPNRSIQRIIYDGPWHDVGFSTLVDVLERINLTLFESLKEVQFRFFTRSWVWMKWEMDSYIKWANLAGQATKKYGVKFTNELGVVWVPRLIGKPHCFPQPRYVPHPEERKRYAMCGSDLQNDWSRKF